jgi:hypothetical protein
MSSVPSQQEVVSPSSGRRHSERQQSFGIARKDLFLRRLIGRKAL